MPDINLLAVFVAALLTFAASFVWYMLLGKQLASVSKAFAESQQHRPQPWKMLYILVEHLVIALILAIIIGRMGLISWSGAVLLGVVLWIGFSATQWISSMVYEQEPLKKAAIHGGDRLIKLIIISGVLGAWR